MTTPVIVLKFGGSVLRSGAALPACVAEVRRWRTSGHAVVAVVSAFAGRTDALLAECQALSPRLSPHSVAARLALGEFESAAGLGVALDAAGVDAAVLEPAALRLLACGDPLDAEPVAVSVAILRDGLGRSGCVVVPGFVAVDESARTVVLGRGGSDLTALFLAQRLSARCRLLKDSGGLFAVDPAVDPSGSPSGDAAGGGRRRPLPRASWGLLRAVGGRVVQQKAIDFAAAHGVAFELGALGSDLPTRIAGEAGGDVAIG